LKKEPQPVNDRIFSQGPDKLRSPERRDRLEVERVVRMCLEDGNVKALLDVGTGSALFAEAFHNAGVSVAGVDINQEMIDAARTHVTDGNFLVAPAEKLPFADGTFDVTFFGVVFHEVSDYAQSLHEAFRVTRHATFILEWQHKQEPSGPPLEHRVKEVFVKDLAFAAGYRSFTAQPLGTLILYRMDK
jgi:ubiquinone/menaquinone biosynthesis C-methylase UbiE